jgi:hypothetical protein
MINIWIRVVAPAAVAAAGVLMPVAEVAAAAPASTPVTCVVANLNKCVVTIPLTSDMNEELSSTMPDDHPWYFNEGGGNSVHAPYTLTDPGWDGSDANTSGHVWDAQLTTGDDEPTGGAAVLTFRHVNSISKPTRKPYAISQISAPTRAKHGARVSITAVVAPKPATGHLLLQRKKAKKWVTAKTMTFDASRKKWIAHLKWTDAAHTSTTFRLDATAAAGLATTHSHTFRIATE